MYLYMYEIVVKHTEHAVVEFGSRGDTRCLQQRLNLCVSIVCLSGSAWPAKWEEWGRVSGLSSNDSRYLCGVDMSMIPEASEGLCDAAWTLRISSLSCADSRSFGGCHIRT